MRRTGFRKPTYEEVIAKQQRDREVRVARALEGLPYKVPSKPKPKKPVPPEAALKKRLWTIFSKYIRRKYADCNGMVMTSDGKYVHWKECDCGHLLPNTERSSRLGGNALWYYENNFAPQSNNGNRFNADGSAGKYMEWAIKRYGVEEVENMRKLKQTPQKFTVEELEQKYRYYVRQFAILDV